MFGVFRKSNHQKPWIKIERKPPRLSDNVENRSVRWLDLGCNTTAGILGVALLAFSVAATVITIQTYGFGSSHASIYAFLGVGTITGIVFAGISFNWMFRAYKKHQEEKGLNKLPAHLD